MLFLDADGGPAALKDRCCHRTAKLSKGRCVEGLLTCGYHGWTYDRPGRVVGIPQFDPGAVLPRHRVPDFRCQARYGYAWVALDEPLRAALDDLFAPGRLQGARYNAATQAEVDSERFSDEH